MPSTVIHFLRGRYELVVRLTSHAAINACYLDFRYPIGEIVHTGNHVLATHPNDPMSLLRLT